MFHPLQQAASKPAPQIVVGKPGVRPVSIGNKPYMTTTTMSGMRPGVKVVHIKPKVMGPNGQEVTINPTLVPRPLIKKGGPGGGLLTMTTSSSTMSKPRTVMVVTATSAKTATVNTKTPAGMPLWSGQHWASENFMTIFDEMPQ